MPTKPTITPAKLAGIESMLRTHCTKAIAARFRVSQETVQLIACGELQTRRDISALARNDPLEMARCPGCGGKTLSRQLRPNCRHCDTLETFPVRAPCHESSVIELRLEPDAMRRLRGIRKSKGMV